VGLRYSNEKSGVNTFPVSPLQPSGYTAYILLTFQSLAIVFRMPYLQVFETRA